jgi:hypothetical protein
VAPKRNRKIWTIVGRMPRPNRFHAITSSSALTGPQTPLSPVTPLDDLERSIFDATVLHHPHLRAADVVILTAFAQSAARVFGARAKGRARARDVAAAHDRDVRSMLALARSLRLTPQSCQEPKTVGRLRVKQDRIGVMAVDGSTVRPWDDDDGDDADESAG